MTTDKFGPKLIPLHTKSVSLFLSKEFGAQIVYLGMGVEVK